MRGRKPKPTSQKLLEGNRGKRRLVKEPPISSVTRTGCPDWYPIPARDFYARYAGEIRRLGNAGEADEPALQALALAWGMMIEAAQKILRPRKRAGHQAYRDHMRIWESLAARFGLTPADRARMLGASKEKEKPASGLLNGEWRAKSMMVATRSSEAVN